MAAGSPDRFPKHLQTLFTSGAIGGLDDDALLERFVASRDEAAFEILVARHGPMVLRVCRAALVDPDEADDAFQAVFLVLVRKAAAIRSSASVASWLFGVAVRVSASAKFDAARRRKHEQQAAPRSPATGAKPVDEPLEFAGVLHEELARLPDRYREALVLCYFEGYTCAAAAGRLRRPVGTVKARLSRARGIMKQRLLRRGVTLPAGLLAAGATYDAAAAVTAVPQELVSATVSSASRLAARRILLLAEGVIKSMLIQKIKTVAALVLSVILAAGMALVVWGASNPGDEHPAQVDVNVKAGGTAAGAPAAGDTPEGAFARAIEALNQDRIDDFVASMHPVAVKRFKTTVVETAEAQARAQAGQGKPDELALRDASLRMWSPAAKNVDDLRKLDDRQLVAKYLTGMFGVSSLTKLTLAGTMGEVLGHIDEDKELVYVVYRSTVDEKGVIRDNLNVARLRRDGARWAMEIPERIEMFIAKQEAVGGRPVIDAQKAVETVGRYEPVGRLLDGNDTAHVVVRRNTPMGEFTRVLTVKSSDLGWKEALAGKPEGLAKLVRFKLAGNRSPEKKPLPVAPSDPNRGNSFAIGTPEAVVFQAMDALRQQRFDDFAATMHPEAVGQLRATLLETAEALARHGAALEILARFPGVKSLEDLKTLADRPFVAKYLAGLSTGLQRLSLRLSQTTGEILGHAEETKEIVHVVYRSTADAEEANRNHLEVAGLQKDGARWALRLPDELANAVEAMKQQAAGNSPKLDMQTVLASRVEPLGRLLTGGDTALVVSRLVTPLRDTSVKRTIVIVVKKSELGWDEAVAGTRESLARLVKANFGLDRTSDSEPIAMTSPAAGRTSSPILAPPDQAPGNVPAEAAAPPPPRLETEPSDRPILARLEMPIALKYPQATPLERILSDIAKATRGTNDPGIPIYVDPVGLLEAEKELTSPVTIELERLPLKDSLPRLLDPLGLAYCVHDGLLIISSPDQIDTEFLRPSIVSRERSSGTRAIMTRLEQPLAMKYREFTPLQRVLSDIVQGTRRPNEPDLPIYVDPVGLEAAEKTMDSPVSLDLEGIPLKTTLRLLLMQLGMSYRVQDGLLIIDAMTDMEDPLVIALDHSPATQAILLRLEQPVALKYPDETPLEKVVSDLAKATRGSHAAGIPIEVDPEGLKEAEQTMTSPVKIELEGVPLRTTLRLMLGPLGLNYCVEDGRLTISDEESILDRRVGGNFKRPGLAADRSPSTMAVLIRLERRRIRSRPAREDLLKPPVPEVPLDQPIPEAPLEQVISDTLKASTGPNEPGIPYHVNPLGFHSIEQTMNLPVPVYDVGKSFSPLRVTLRLVVDRLGLDYYVQDGLLIVAASEVIGEELKRAPVLALDQSPATRAIATRLERPIAMRYPNPTSLEKVVEDITRATQGPNDPAIPISIDPSGLKAAGTTMTSPVGRIDLEGIPLRTTLRLALAPMGLAYSIENGRLMISDDASVEAKRTAAAKNK